MALIAARRPDLVLADVMMPHLDGFGLLAAIRADPLLRTCPRLTAAVAFDRLRQVSRDRNVKLRDVAERVIETGEDPARPGEPVAALAAAVLDHVAACRPSQRRVSGRSARHRSSSSTALGC
jgi:CheY-like chemotaxis protein